MRISSLLKTKRHKKKKVTVKLNPRQVTSLKKQRELLKNGYNTKFLAEVQPGAVLLLQIIMQLQVMDMLLVYL